MKRKDIKQVAQIFLPSRESNETYIRSILIANRGEIAIRIMKTARKMGLKTWCFQTPQEVNAVYLSYADSIIQIPDDGRTTPVFLDMEAIVQYARLNQIDSIHPGYGFLAENPDLCRRCNEEGILFIGPSEASIRQMGDKNEAKKLAVQIGIPVIKGSDSPINEMSEALIQAREIGFPIMLKPLAGGGGKGMRIVHNEKELDQVFSVAVNEALNAFGNGAMLIEKCIERSRHIEIQLLADQHGNAIHLFERECSVQRNHQKLLEEAPSVALTPDLRESMTQSALALCKSVNYSTLGTVEFLLDEAKNYYFLEMNTRIQVEHPVTEAITGLDLVELQIRTAAGETLFLKQKEVKCKGWAFEFRINAEDVQASFTPNFGIIDEFSFPESPYLRVDSGFNAGSVMPAFFDSLVAKAIVTGKTRKDALTHAFHILKEIQIKGIKTTITFALAAIKNENFASGNFDSTFVEHLEPLYFQEKNEERAAAMIALQSYLEDVERIENNSIKGADPTPWFSRMWNKII